MTEPAPTEVVVADAPGASRYEARVDGELAGLIDYRLHGDRIALNHTEVLPAFQGHGIAGRLVSGALDDARARGLAVLPYCPLVRSYIERHPEYLDLVPASRRARFGL